MKQLVEIQLGVDGEIVTRKDAGVGQRKMIAPAILVLMEEPVNGIVEKVIVMSRVVLIIQVLRPVQQITVPGLGVAVRILGVLIGIILTLQPV